MAVKQKAIIYCRVSSAAQLQKGDGLASQETRCRDYARHRGYSICEVFKDEGASGGVIDRPAMQAMLVYLHRHSSDRYVVLIDDISRLARGLEAHIQLRAAIGAAGAYLESPTIEFGEDSDSQLVEHMLASVSQHQRQKNAEQTINRMKARVMNGYWVFNPPLGYCYSRVAGHGGQVLIPDEPVASVIKEALESFACGHFETQGEVKRFLDASPHYPKDSSGEVRFQRVTNLLNKVIYTGYIEVPNWNVSLRQGKHEALISFEAWKVIQEKLHGKPKAPTRKDVSADFPLRGFVLCADCQHPMTACWSKGRKTAYPYYLCFKKGCVSYRKSIHRDRVEDEFTKLLDTATPPASVFELADGLFRQAWESHATQRQQEAVSLESELQNTTKQIDILFDRIVNADSQTLLKAYERKVQMLEENKIVLQEKIAKCGRSLPDYDKTFRTALDFLENPQKLWASGGLENKRKTLKLVFSEPLAYDREMGFRTADFSLPFKVLSDLKGKECDMAEREGFEPSIPV